MGVKSYCTYDLLQSRSTVAAVRGNDRILLAEVNKFFYADDAAHPLHFQPSCTHASTGAINGWIRD